MDHTQATYAELEEMIGYEARDELLINEENTHDLEML